MIKNLISVVAVNWWADDFAKLLYRSLLHNAKESFEFIIVDNSGELKSEDYPRATIVKTEKNIGHGKGMDLGIQKAHGEFILTLDIDTHILLKNWDTVLKEFFANNPEKKLLGATDGCLLKPARPLAMFFKKKHFREQSFVAEKIDSVKFDVGIKFYFSILSMFGDSSFSAIPYAKTKYIDVLGTEYLLNGQRFIYHNWWGTRWFNYQGEQVHEDIDGIRYCEYLRKRNNLFEQTKYEFNSTNNQLHEGALSMELS